MPGTPSEVSIARFSGGNVSSSGERRSPLRSRHRVNYFAPSTHCWAVAEYRRSTTSTLHSFIVFFDDKVAGVRSATADAPPPSFLPTSRGASFHQFQPVTVEEVIAAVRALPDKSCALDPLPTAQLKLKRSSTSSLHFWPTCLTDLCQVAVFRKHLKTRSLRLSW